MASSGQITGRVSVVDGDTFDVGSTRVRLFGIDAPEADQTCKTKQGAVWKCGAWVTHQARSKYQGRGARCDPTGDVTYNRIVARCQINGRDVQKELVTDGLAFAYRKYSADYAAAEDVAAAKGLGVWSGSVTRPDVHRRAMAAQSDAGCRIKGNRSAAGQIFHVPGSKFYDKTQIDRASGERWFCSVQEAELAGWRAPRG